MLLLILLSSHPPSAFCRPLESVSPQCTGQVFVSGPTGDVGWVAVVPSSCLFPLGLSSLVLGSCAPRAGTGLLCVMQQQHSRRALQ